MRAIIKVERKPIDDLPMTLTVTLPIGEWREIGGAMPNRYPLGRFGSLLANAISQVEKSVNQIVDSVEIDHAGGITHGVKTE